MATNFTINGKAVSVDAPPDTPLLWVVREGLKLTGTTLTSDADSTWSAPAGSGNERDGLLRTGAVSAFVPPAVVAKASAPSATSRALARPEPTPLAQLSRKPSPPPLADAAR